MDSRSLPNHTVYFILHHSVPAAFRATVESSPGLLIVFVLAVAVVTPGEITIDSILMASVLNENVTTSNK